MTEHKNYKKSEQQSSRALPASQLDLAVARSFSQIPVTAR